MTAPVSVVVYPVRDLDRAKSFYGALTGAAPDVDSPTFVQFTAGEQRIGLDPNGHSRGFPGSVGYWQVEDIHARFQDLLAAGATGHEPVRDVGNGTLIASVIDADGNVIGLIQPA
jgi:predicted enzyme related to lactoylglutathione lyase